MPAHEAIVYARINDRHGPRNLAAPVSYLLQRPQHSHSENSLPVMVAMEIGVIVTDIAEHSFQILHC